MEVLNKVDLEVTKHWNEKKDMIITIDEKKKAARELIETSESMMREARTDKLMLFLKLRYKN